TEALRHEGTEKSTTELVFSLRAFVPNFGVSDPFSEEWHPSCHMEDIALAIGARAWIKPKEARHVCQTISMGGLGVVAWILRNAVSGRLRLRRSRPRPRSPRMA